MNRLLVLLLIVATSALSARAQINESGLSKDPVFAAITAKRINYPAAMASRAVYGRVWAGSRVDKRGRIRDIKLLHPHLDWLMGKRYGIEYEIRTGLNHIPPLNPVYEGEYLLPVAFCFTHYNEGSSPIIPTNQLPVGVDTGDRTLLPEVRIFAKTPSYTRGLSGFSPSRQIDQP